MDELTTIEKGMSTRKQIQQAIIGYIQEHGYSPSVREIGEMVGLKSTSSVHHHISIMLKNGMLETDHGIGAPITIRVPGYEFIKMK